MGAAASVSGPVSKEKAKEIAGSKWNEEIYDDVADFEGIVDQEQWGDLVATTEIQDMKLDQLKVMWKKANDANKTLLVLDSTHKTGSTKSDISKIDQYLTYQTVKVLEAKKVMVEVQVKKEKTKEQGLEDMRTALVQAMKHTGHVTGMPLLLRMSNTAVDITNNFSSDTTFPLAAFEPKEFVKEEVWKKILRPEDDPDMFIYGKDFQLIITSEFQVGDAIGFLKGSLPLDKCLIVNVIEGVTTKYLPKHGDRAILAGDGDGEPVTIFSYAPDGMSNIKKDDGKVCLVKSELLSKAPPGTPPAPAAAPAPAPAAAPAAAVPAAAKKKKGGKAHGGAKKKGGKSSNKGGAKKKKGGKAHGGAKKKH